MPQLLQGYSFPVMNFSGYEFNADRGNPQNTLVEYMLNREEF